MSPFSTFCESIYTSPLRVYVIIGRKEPVSRARSRDPTFSLCCAGPGSRINPTFVGLEFGPPLSRPYPLITRIMPIAGEPHMICMDIHANFERSICISCAYDISCIYNGLNLHNFYTCTHESVVYKSCARYIPISYIHSGLTLSNRVELSIQTLNYMIIMYLSCARNTGRQRRSQEFPLIGGYRCRGGGRILPFPLPSPSFPPPPFFLLPFMASDSEPKKFFRAFICSSVKFSAF
jgi:hypothetical protein